MLWCDSVAPFGKPVVPEVYWMLIGSSHDNEATRESNADAEAEEADDTSASHVESPM